MFMPTPHYENCSGIKAARCFVDTERVTAGALSVELDKIGELQGRGEIDEDIAQQLRQNVYVLQMNAEAE